MKRNYLLAFTLLLTASVSAQWRQVGLEGRTCTNGGVQMEGANLYYHAKEDGGAIYFSRDQGVSWGQVQFAGAGDPWKYARYGSSEFAHYGVESDGPTTLGYHIGDAADWHALAGTITDFMVVDPGRIIAVVENNGQRYLSISNLDGAGTLPVLQPNGNVQVRLIGKDGLGRPLAQTYGPEGTTDDVIGLFRSADGGISWQQVGDVEYDLTGASAHADHSIYASNGLRVLRSLDDGASWEVLSVGFPYATLSGSRMFNMGGGHVFFMCYEPGNTNLHNVYESFDSGKTWSPVMDGISRLLVFNMVADDEGNVYAATNNGVYRLDAQMVSVGAYQGHDANVFAYPTPAVDHVVVNAGGAMIKEIRLFDATGREVMFRPDVGKPAEKLMVGQLPSGAYLLRAVTNKGIATTRVVIQ